MTLFAKAVSERYSEKQYKKEDLKNVDPKEIRPDLAEAIARHETTLDEARPEAVERRHKNGQRTIRENIADLLDPDKSIEYGSLTLAAQRRRQSMDALIKKSPADGLVAKIGSVNGHLFEAVQNPLSGTGIRLHRPGRYPGLVQP